MTRLAASALLLVAAIAGCTSGDGSEADPETPAPSQSTSSAAAPSPSDSSPSATATAPTPADVAFDRAAAMATVRDLAGLGPREATSDAYRTAASTVEDRFTELGYDVSQQDFRVPQGESWGIPVDAGSTTNVVARPPDFDPDQPYVLVGAHLDTVPQAPGAEDNGSGVAVLLELARMAAEAGTGAPVVLVAFGAEEPRGPADDEHHFGSQTYVRRFVDVADPQRLIGMVSLDRVGAPGRVPVCTGGQSPDRVRRQLLAAAGRIGVPARSCVNRTSDHWPFEKAGETVARVGGNDSPGYHSADDLPRTVSPRQLARVGAVVWEWLRRG